jgi:uncharacterized protein (TIGR00297 family)
LQEVLLKLGASVLPNLGLGIAGYAVRAFDRSGFILGVILGSLITYAFGWGGFLAVLCFVVLWSVTTRLGFSRKAARGISEPAEGRRTWRNAAANLAVPAFGALVALVSPAPVLKMFFTASVATAAFDTVASEMGKTFGGRALTLQDMKVKEPGVPGGITVVGTVSGAVAAAAIALVALGFGLISPWLVGYVVVSAFLAAAAESLLKSAVGLRSAHAANVINTLLGGLFGALFWTGGSTV